MSSEFAAQKAANAWCTPKTSHIVMDVHLAEAFAEIIEELTSQAYLGNATTAELLQELMTRAEIHGYANYRTVD